MFRKVLPSLLLVTAFSVPVFASTINSTTSTDLQISIRPTIDIALSSKDVKLHPQVGLNDGFASGDTTVTVTTNSGYGYILQLSATSDDPALKNGASAIPTLSDQVSLTDFKADSSHNNQWGFTHDNAALLKTGVYLPVPKLSTPAVIKDATSASDAQTTVTFGAKIDGTLPAGTYQNTVVFTAIAGHAPLPTMQNFTADECSKLTSSTVRTDNRDNHDYTIAKLADGKCWMLDNLRLAPGTTINNVNSNITASTYTLPDTWGDSNYSPFVHAANNDVDGVYYNWHAATAQTNSGAVAEPTTSICPAGWKLPTSAVFTTLISAYGSNITTFNAAFNNNYSGYVVNATVNEAGTVADWWASDSASTNAYILRIKGTSISAGGTVAKRGGRPIRCYFAG